MIGKLSNNNTNSNRLEDIIIDNDEQLLFNIKNLKIFSIDQTDKHAMRYDLLSKTGELKLFIYKHEVNLSLNETDNLYDSYSKRKFLEIPFQTLKFNELQIKNKKLTIKHQLQTSKNFYCFELNSSNLDELIDIRKSLINFKDIYYPELEIKKTCQPVKNDSSLTVVDENKSNSDISKSESNKDISIAVNNKKRKWREDEVLKIFDVLVKAIKTGNSEDASKNAKLLADMEIDISITLNNQNINNNGNDHEIKDKEDFQQIEIDNGLFNVFCSLIKEDQTEKKTIFLENLDLNMKISDLKQKVACFLI